MKHLAHRTVYLIAVLLALNSFNGGCANQNIDSPSRVAQAESIYNTTLGVLIDLRRAGKIDDNLYREIDEYRTVANSALDRAKTAAANSDNNNMRIALDAAHAAIDEMVRRRYLVEKRTN